MRPAAATLYQTNLKKHDKTAREWTLKYAIDQAEPNNQQQQQPTHDQQLSVNTQYWCCQICTFRNKAEIPVCSMCGIGVKTNVSLKFLIVFAAKNWSKQHH